MEAYKAKENAQSALGIVPSAPHSSKTARHFGGFLHSKYGEVEGLFVFVINGSAHT